MSDAIRVLVVDDDPTVLMSLCAFLEDEGFAVFSSSGADEAMKIIADEPLEVVVVDVRLREMSGEQVLLRGRAIRPSAKFLIHTGSLGYRISTELGKLGMTQEDVLYKPVRMLSVVADAIRRAAGRS